MKLLSSLVFVCIGIYISYNHPEIAAVMYEKFIVVINTLLGFFGKSL